MAHSSRYSLIDQNIALRAKFVEDAVVGEILKKDLIFSLMTKSAHHIKAIKDFVDSEEALYYGERVGLEHEFILFILHGLYFSTMLDADRQLSFN